MQRRTWAAMTIGAAVGSVLGIGVLVVAASRLLEGGVTVPLEGGGGVFVVGEGAMHALIAVAAAVGGAVLGALGYAVGREADPGGPSHGMGPMVAVGAATGVIVGFAAARAGLGLAADISVEVVTVSVFRASMVALAAGAATGAVVGGAVERLARPETMAFQGEAWPSRIRFLREAAAAVGLPLVAVAGGSALVAGFAIVLLEASKESALALFGGVAALILLGAVIIAANPPRRGRG